MTALTTENPSEPSLKPKCVAHARYYYETDFVSYALYSRHKRDAQKPVKAESKPEDELESNDQEPEPPVKKAKKAPSPVKVSQARGFLANVVHLVS
jgi:hypothetical protein